MKKLNWKSHGKLFGFGTSPEADWKIIFLAAAFLALLVTLLNAFIFWKIDKGEIFVVEPASQEELALDIVKLRETVLYYQNKAKELERIKSTTITGNVDPSL